MGVDVHSPIYIVAAVAGRSCLKGWEEGVLICAQEERGRKCALEERKSHAIVDGEKVGARKQSKTCCYSTSEHCKNKIKEEVSKYHDKTRYGFVARYNLKYTKIPLMMEVEHWKCIIRMDSHAAGRASC